MVGAHFEGAARDDHERYVAVPQGVEDLLAGAVAQSIIDDRRIDIVRGDVIECGAGCGFVGLGLRPHFFQLEMVVDRDERIVFDDKDALATKSGILILRVSRRCMVQHGRAQKLASPK